MAATKKKVVTKKRRMKLSDFLFKGELGRGTYGSVFKALRRGKTKPYAIKVINMKGMTKKQLHDCSEEVRILSSLKNANIVKYLDSFVDAGKLYIVMEYVPNGTLYDFYKNKREKAEENFVWTTLVSLCLALPKAGSSMPARMAMMAITTNSSIKVKPLKDLFFRRYEGIFLEPHGL